MADEDDIPAMPADFASTPPDEQWKRIQRANRAKARLDADLATRSAELEAMRAQLAEAAPLKEQVAKLTAAQQAAEAKAARLELRLPLYRLGVEDDEIHDVVLDRWAKTAGSGDKPVPLPEWIQKGALEDKIVGPLLRKPDGSTAKRAGNTEAGAAATTTTTAGTVITREQFLADRALNPHRITELQRRYNEQNGIVYAKK